MSDLINKLNVLIRATVSSGLSAGGAPGDDRDRATPRPAQHLSDQAVDAQIKTLRQHIDAALNAEDGMRQKIENAQNQNDQLDQQVDAALLDGDSANARVLAQRLQQQRQRLVSQQADLDLHRRATSELIEQVNQLEAQISDARANQDPVLEPLESLTVDPSEKVEIPLQVDRSGPSKNSDGPRTVRVPINVRPTAPPTDPPPAVSPAATAPPPVSSPDVDDDLARRRSRLSGPDKTDKN